jgi:Capsule biosynthesis GfcC
MSPRLLALLLGTITAATATAAPQVSVEVMGHVSHPGPQILPAGARLSDAILAANPQASAYPLAAAWLRASEQIAQTRLKAGVLFDLAQLVENTSADADDASVARTLADDIKRMPVTGRVPALLSARAVEVAEAGNRLLGDGDRLVYPARPTTVTVMGVVAEPCTLEHVAQQAPLDYLRRCPALRVANKDDLYVIEPDGRVEKIGIALWNRSASSTLAPGAVLYVPLRPSALARVNPELNEGIAGFLATQVMDVPGVSL